MTIKTKETLTISLKLYYHSQQLLKLFFLYLPSYRKIFLLKAICRAVNLRVNVAIPLIKYTNDKTTNTFDPEVAVFRHIK